MYWGAVGNLSSIRMAFLNGSGRTTLYRESAAQYTGITLFNNSLYISDSSRRYGIYYLFYTADVWIFVHTFSYFQNLLNCLSFVYTEIFLSILK